MHGQQNIKFLLHVSMLHHYKGQLCVLYLKPRAATQLLSMILSNSFRLHLSVDTGFSYRFCIPRTQSNLKNDRHVLSRLHNPRSQQPIIDNCMHTCNKNKNNKGIPRQAEVALGVPGRLRPRIFSTFGTTRVVGRLYPRRSPWYSFSEAESTSEHVDLSDGNTGKIPSDTTVDRSRDRLTSSAAP
jgi:hypothetical protein